MWDHLGGIANLPGAFMYITVDKMVVVVRYEKLALLESEATNNV